MINVIVVKCPLYPNRVIGLSYTDTIEGWDDTVDHCGNVLMSEVTGTDGRITKTYAVWSDAEINTVAFHRPKGNRPQVHNFFIH